MFKLIGRSLVVLVFGWAGCASATLITDTLTVDGKEWAQVDLFAGLTWDEINAVCPGGVCGNGTLKGYEMSGWSWATTADMNSLFNHYIGFAALGPGPGEYRADPDTFANLFFADGWRITGNVLGSSKVTEGFTADSSQYWSDMTAFSQRDGAIFCGLIGCGPGGLPGVDIASTNMDLVNPFLDQNLGAWFKRAATEVPGPATLPLFGLALAGLRYSRGKPR